MIVALDTNIVIYMIEQNPIWTPKALTRLGELRKANCEIALCDAARFECLVKPLASNVAAHVATYQSFFNSPHVQMLSVTAAAWERAARIGAASGLKPLDAVHLATAIEHGCGLFLTNDAQLTRCTDIQVEVLA